MTSNETQIITAIPYEFFNYNNSNHVNIENIDNIEYSIKEHTEETKKTYYLYSKLPNQNEFKRLVIIFPGKDIHTSGIEVKTIKGSKIKINRMLFSLKGETIVNQFNNLIKSLEKQLSIDLYVFGSNKDNETSRFIDVVCKKYMNVFKCRFGESEDIPWFNDTNIYSNTDLFLSIPCITYINGKYKLTMTADRYYKAKTIDIE